jgi:hypothetical protein
LKRRLKSGGTADIYKVVLTAATGPKSEVSYEDLRKELIELLVDEPPQKHEVTSALKHLSTISQDIGNDAGIDWDNDERRINISDPYLRFYLRWQIRPVSKGGQSQQLFFVDLNMLYRHLQFKGKT